MREARGDLWELGRYADAVVVTTNGTVMKNGDAVMGAGCALEVAQMYGYLPRLLGRAIQAKGNHVHVFYVSPEQPVLKPIVMFPVKDNVLDKAKTDLIERSAEELVQLADTYWWKHVVMPRPGCGFGGLKWEGVTGVQKLLASLLDDRFTAVTW